VADLQKRFELASRIRDKVSQANEAVLLIRGVRSQVDDRVKKTSDAGIRKAGEELEEHLAAIEGRIYQVRIRSRQDPLNYPIMLNNKLAALAGVVEDGEFAPTEQSYAVFTDLSSRLDRELAALDALLGKDLPSLNQKLESAHLPAVERKPEAAVEPGTPTGPGLAEEGDEDEDE
jgi:hypothetical protein